jgi:1-deoxy-D-xylulose-5-phosphate reductoisomerase
MAALTARKVVVLGSTGSIGVSTLDLFEQSKVPVEILALAAGRNVERLAQQALRWRPKLAVIEDEALLGDLRERLAGSGVEAAAGSEAVAQAAAMGADWVMSAIVGAAGLAPTLAAARTGAVVALANKESLVCAGPELLRISRQAGGTVIPVDSEHSAIFQVLQPACLDRVARLILTASGGPFRTWTREQMAVATPEQAIAHPYWSMGAKISVDSATLMNKGLELIEADRLFPVGAGAIDVVVPG